MRDVYYTAAQLQKKKALVLGLKNTIERRTNSDSVVLAPAELVG